VELNNLVVDGEVFPSLSLDWKGNLKNHRVNANLVASAARMNLEFVGACHSDTWNFKIDKASFDLGDYGTWRLIDHPVIMRVSHSGIKPFKACWAQEDSSVCIEGSWRSEEGWHVQGNLNDPPLNRMIDVLKALIQRPKLDKKFYKTGDIDYR
jgi:hypothetical protein